MPDEKKTYLINIESNLKKYAEEAAEAKKKVDELKVANDALKQSGTASAAEMEAHNAILKNAQDEYRKAQNLAKTAAAAISSETGSRKQLGEILKLQEQALGKLGSAYIKNAQGMDVLNPKYIEQRNDIAATKQAIIDYDKSLNDGRSNIGRYGEAVNTAFQGVVQNMKAMLGPAALVAAAVGLAKKIFEGLKDAIMSTTGAINAMNIITGTTKQLFYDLITTGKINIQNLYDAAEAIKILNGLRTEGYRVEVEESKLELQLQKLRFEAADQTRSNTDRLDKLTKVEDLENQKIKIKVDHLKEEYNAINDLIQKRPTDEKLQQRALALITEINQVRAEEFTTMKRVETQRTGLIEKEIKDRKKEYDDLADWWVKASEEDKKNIKERDAEIDRSYAHFVEYWNKEDAKTAKETADKDKKIEEDWKRFNTYWDKQDAETAKRNADDIAAGFEYAKLKAKTSRTGFDDLNNILDQEYEALKNSTDYKLLTDNQKLLAEQKYTDAKLELTKIRRQAMLQELDTFASITASLSELTGKQTIAGKAFAVANTLINTYMAGVKAMAELPIGAGPLLRFLTLAAVIAAGLAQVKNILAVDVSGKSSAISSAPTSISSSPPAQKAFASSTGSTIFTQPALTQTQLNTMPNQNLLTVDDIARALSKIPAPIVTVEDINAKVKEVKKVTVRATI
jgi:hypothetical protein